MDLSNRYDGVHPRALQFVRYHARQLARRRAVPGMELEDYEQDLITDLLVRERRFDPTRAAYPTFADRIIRHRVSTLTQGGARMRRAGDGELDATAREQSLEAQALSDWTRTEDGCSLRLDLERFVGTLPLRLRRCCHWLLAENRLAAAAALGLHRSSLYEAAHELKQRAIEASLQLYLETSPSPTSPDPAR